MNNLKAFLSVVGFLVLSLSLMSFKIPDTGITEENNILIYVIGGVSVILILLFVFFTSQSVLQDKKNAGLPSSFSNTDDS